MAEIKLSYDLHHYNLSIFPKGGDRLAPHHYWKLLPKGQWHLILVKVASVDWGPCTGLSSTKNLQTCALKGIRPGSILQSCSTGCQAPPQCCKASGAGWLGCNLCTKNRGDVRDGIYWDALQILLPLEGKKKKRFSWKTHPSTFYRGIPCRYGLHFPTSHSFPISISLLHRNVCCQDHWCLPVCQI